MAGSAPRHAGAPRPKDNYAKQTPLILTRALLKTPLFFATTKDGDVPSFVETDFPDSAGARHPFRLLSLPLYLASEARRLVEERL